MFISAEQFDDFCEHIIYLYNSKSSERPHILTYSDLDEMALYVESKLGFSKDINFFELSGYLYGYTSLFKLDGLTLKSKSVFQMSLSAVSNGYFSDDSIYSFVKKDIFEIVFAGYGIFFLKNHNIDTASALTPVNLNSVNSYCNSDVILLKGLNNTVWAYPKKPLEPPHQMELSLYKGSIIQIKHNDLTYRLSYNISPCFNDISRVITQFYKGNFCLEHTVGFDILKYDSVRQALHPDSVRICRSGEELIEIMNWMGISKHQLGLEIITHVIECLKFGGISEEPLHFFGYPDPAYSLTMFEYVDSLFLKSKNCSFVDFLKTLQMFLALDMDINDMVS